MIRNWLGNRLTLAVMLALTTAVVATGCGDDDGMNPDAGGDAMTDGMVGMPGSVVTPTTGLTTTEAGGTATFTIVLTAAPNADVTIGLSSSNDAEGTVSPDTLTFTSENWNAPQTVTVTGVDDAIADGDQTYMIITGDTTSADTNYEGLMVDDVTVTNTDDESAGVTVDPTSGLVTTESGDTATFTVVLNAPPTADVTIPITTSDDTEGTASPDSLTFTPENFDAPQTVTVTGVDDAEVDGDVVYTIQTGAATSDDTGYSGFDADDVEVTNTDDESAGVTVDPTEGLTTTEAGGTAELTVVLNSAPTVDVTIPVSSSDTGEGTVSPDSLTFTTENWDAPQTITVTGVDDAIADGGQIYMVIIGAATSADPEYMDVDGADATVTNTDDDSAGVTVMPLDGLVTGEDGTTDTFTIVLNSAPTADVTFPISSSDTTEGDVSPTSVTFTTANWDAPQTITVTGVDDAAADGGQIYNAVVGVATSSDPGYNGLDPADVEVTNTDNDSAGVTVMPIDGLVTTEAGGTDTFTVVLNSRPSADVTFAISSDDPTEGLPTPTTLTFTPDNWDAPQTVTVTGQDDAVADGSPLYNIVVGAATSGDAGYMGIDPPDVEVTNTDDDSPGITVNPTTGLTTTEAGGDDTFSIVLNSRPTADVTISITSSDTGEGTVSAPSLTFTPDNWDAPQVVTVTGVDDPVQDGNQTYTIITGDASSTDGGYDGLVVDDVDVSNTDNDSAGFTVTPTSGLVTTEAGITATFDVVLNSQPSDDVVITLDSDDTSEGTVDLMMLTFTTANWNAPQTVTITGQSDAVFDGDQPYTIVLDAATSTDTDYDMLNPDDVSVTNLDLDAGVFVTPTSGLITTEAGGQATFTVVLNVAPTADVFFTLTSDDTTEGTVSPSLIQFTPANWDAPQTVTVTGVDDPVADGDQPFMIATGDTSSTQPAYNGLVVDDVAVTNEDDETAGIIVSAPSPRETTESGASYVFGVRLQSQPTGDVVIDVESSDLTEGTVAPAQLTFTAVNWNANQPVTVTGVDDLFADGNQQYRVRLLPAMSGDAAYDGLDASDPLITNVDDETAGFEVTPLSVVTREDGTVSPTFQVRLRSQPTAQVDIAVTSSDPSEATVSASMLSFTALNWNAFRPVTVTGVEDAVADGDQSYTIELAPATSTDATYDGLNPPDVSGTNVDNDSPGITVTPTTGLTTTEAGGQATFEIVLDSQPTADVRVSVRTLDSSEGTVSPAAATFTSANWNAPQTFTVTGVDDFVQDGDVSYVIEVRPATSTDPGYVGLDGDDVTVTNEDNETAGVTVSPTVGLSITEAGGQDTFTVVLDSQPTADVTIGISSNDGGEGTAAPSSLTFTAANWDAPQVVTVTGQDDNVADGDQTFLIVTTAASSADGNYNGLPVDDVDVTCVDDETAGVTVAGTFPVTTSEAGGSDTFTIVLDSQPTANVTIGLSSSDSGEGVPAISSVTFTPGNWNFPQTVTVSGVDDAVADGTQNYIIITADAMSADPNYDGFVVDDAAARNIDNETPGISVTPTAGLLTNEAGSVTDTFDIVLDSQPLNDVTIPLTASDEASVVASVTFTAGNWDTPQTVTVTGVDDFVQDGNQTFTITVGPSTSADANYMGLTGSTVNGINLDDETAGFTIMQGTTPDLITDETGAADLFSVVLNSQPAGGTNAFITFTWDTSEGDLDETTLTFTPANWDTPQVVIVTGVDDGLADGAIFYNIDGDPSGSTDPNYAALSSFSIGVFNLDDD